jgi:hypothetical protein
VFSRLTAIVQAGAVALSECARKAHANQGANPFELAIFWHNLTEMATRSEPPQKYPENARIACLYVKNMQNNIPHLAKHADHEYLRPYLSMCERHTGREALLHSDVPHATRAENIYFQRGECAS